MAVAGAVTVLTRCARCLPVISVTRRHPGWTRSTAEQTPTQTDGPPHGFDRRDGANRQKEYPMSTVTTALREAADLLDQHPDLPPPYITSSSDGTVDLNWFLNIQTSDLAEQKRIAAEIVRALGGAWEKSSGDWGGGTFRFTQERGLMSFDVQTRREAVCERVVTGTETVTIPAKPAEPERTEEREVVEWRCAPLLAEVSSS